MRLRHVLAASVVVALAVPGAAGAIGDPNVAALQVALREHRAYHATIDGVRGPATTAAVATFQRRRGLAADGVAGPQTRRALGRLGRPPYRSRHLSTGAVGWDVAALQFLLAWHGFPSGPFDGRFGPRVDAALRGFQSWAGLGPDGVAGPATYRALSRALARSPLWFSAPVPYAIGDRFGPRGERFHPGVDIPAPSGTPVRAGRAGTVVFTGRGGSYGLLVVVAHARGVESWYAHLSRLGAVAGEWVRRGEVIGRVGSTGRSTGPHLHFELRLRGAAVDPVPALR